ncbi:hypothetical protein JW824_07895 [bacterium]|nr:hypothetical protein [bacterium]
MNTETTQDNHTLSLEGRHLFIPRMSTVGSEALAAVFRSLGIAAEVSPPSDESTLSLAARFTTGEECLPQRITLGNFLKIILRKDFDPQRYAFFLPTSSGPCRFGQYAPFLRKILRELDYPQALVFSPTSSNGYGSFGTSVFRFYRSVWRCVVVSDILRKLQLMFRPYESNSGETDTVQENALAEICSILADGSLSLKKQLDSLVDSLEKIRDQFLGIPLISKRNTKPLIGIVGEIFLRLNSFSNQYIIRKIESLGGEVWMADVSEWVWYTHIDQERKLRSTGRKFSMAMFGTRLKSHYQKGDEDVLLKPFRHLFQSREEASVRRLLQYSMPYLPSHMALGEMTLNTGKAIAYHHAGCDGVIDASPFTCMNGIVTEAIYPKVSRDYGHMPIRIFYFDGVPFDLESDLEIFFEQVKSFKQNKRGKTQSNSI